MHQLLTTMLIFIFQEHASETALDSLLNLVVEDPNAHSSYQEFRLEWWSVILITATVVAGGMLLVKFLLKASSSLKGRAWSRLTAYAFLFIGLFPVLGITCLWYFVVSSEDDFRSVIGSSGLAIGTMFSWLMYLFLMLVGHLGRWRRDLF